MEKVIAIFQQGPCRQARFLDNIGKTAGHTGLGKTRFDRAIGGTTIQKVAIGGQKSSFILRTRFGQRNFRVR
jgi:hypothetical protein